MKQNWTYKKLEEIGDINYGTRVVQKKDKGTKYYVYGGGDATFMVDDYNREDCFIVSRFAMSPKCTRFVKGKFFLNDSGLSVSTKIKDLYQPFLDKALLANNDTIFSMGKGMAQKNLDIPSFRNLSIPVPPLVEQQRIVSEFDLLQGIIDKQQAQLKELAPLAQSIFYDMFGDPVENEKKWVVKRLGDVCEVTSSKRVYQSEWQTTGIPFYRISDFTQLIDNVEFDAKVFISPEKYDELKRNDKVPKSGDILVTSRGTLGNCYIVKDSDCFYFQDGMVTWLKNMNEGLLPLFIFFLFKSDSFRSQIDKRRGTTVTYLSIKMLKEFILPVPPLSLQQEFAEKIEKIERQKSAISQSIAETRKLFDYTMDKYFG